VSYALKEVSERPFPANRIAYQQCQKIDRFIAAEATSYQADLMRKGIKKSLRCQVLDDDHLIARTMQAPRGDQEEWFGPQYRD